MRFSRLWVNGAEQRMLMVESAPWTRYVSFSGLSRRFTWTEYVSLRPTGLRPGKHPRIKSIFQCFRVVLRSSVSFQANIPRRTSLAAGETIRKAVSDVQSPEIEMRLFQ